MAQNSKIEWTDHTFNPWWGCTKISAGCAHCYADTYSTFRGHKVWGDNAGRRFFTDKHWNEPLQWNREAERAGKVARVFCGSMCDVMEARPELDRHIYRLYGLIDRTPWLKYLLLTKRPENYERRLPLNWLLRLPDNVILGCTAENQEMYDQRMPFMEALHAKGFRTFLSMEPLLGPIGMGMSAAFVDWAIVGGESGPGARPMHPDWARGLRDQCVPDGIPFFFKQWGEHIPWVSAHGAKSISVVGVKLRTRMMPDGTIVAPGTPMSRDQMDDYIRRGVHMVRVGKQKAGRLLDGREWNELPHMPSPAEVAR